MSDCRPTAVHLDDLAPAQRAELVRRRAAKDQWAEYGVAWWWPFFSIPVGGAGCVLIFELLAKYGRGAESITFALPIGLGAAVCVALALVGLVHFVRSFGTYGRTLTSFGYAEVRNKQLWVFSWAALARLHGMSWDEMRRTEPRAMRTYWFENEIRNQLGDRAARSQTHSDPPTARRHAGSFGRAWAMLSGALLLVVCGLFGYVHIDKLGNEADKRARDTAWVTEITDPLVHIRRQAAADAAKLCTPDQVPVLLAALSDRSAAVRGQAAESLASVYFRVKPTELARKRLTAAATDDAVVSVRAKAIRAVSLMAGHKEIDGSDGTWVLRRGTKATDSMERRAAIRGVATARSHMPDALTVLLAAAGPEDTRPDVVAALSRLHEKVLPKLEATGQGTGPSAEVARAAACSLHARAFRRRLRSVKKAADRQARLQAFKICGKPSLRAIWAVVPDAPSDKFADAALGKLGEAGPLALPFLVKAAHLSTYKARGSNIRAMRRGFREERIRRLAVSLIGRHGHTKAAATLVMALKRDKSETVRIAAAKALGVLGPGVRDVAIAPLQQAAKHRSKSVAEAAQAAIVAIEGK
ncbi:MAG: HEAT repeat domain-containing protein [Myxococcales bacterium]|nr:HEAT repeat domain-containing protein [Myxococcales bacterium]